VSLRFMTRKMTNTAIITAQISCLVLVEVFDVKEDNFSPSVALIVVYCDL
jgi:hypothetical protein